MVHTRVLAIASHVAYGYVGNKMVSFVLQALGCDVSAINTVYFSNHTGYKSWKGRKVSAEEIEDLWEGLKTNELDSFDAMLSGYSGSKEVVESIGRIGQHLQARAADKPGTFFWILDPVMGDEGRLYVNDDIVPAYKALLSSADMILPNAFEAEILSETKINDKQSLVQAITELHSTYRIPHIVITSVQLPLDNSPSSSKTTRTLTIVGSSCREDLSPRIFSVTVPSIPVFFSGTGDMFAALMLVRLRDASKTFSSVASWKPQDNVSPTELPLARAVEMSLASMHAVLVRTASVRATELGKIKGNHDTSSIDRSKKTSEGDPARLDHVRQTRASEVRVVEGVDDLRSPSLVHRREAVLDQYDFTDNGVVGFKAVELRI